MHGFDLGFTPDLFLGWGYILYLCSQGKPDIFDIKNLQKATKISTLRK